MSLGSLKLKIDVKMTKIQKAVKSKKAWINIYLERRFKVSFRKIPESTVNQLYD